MPFQFYSTSNHAISIRLCFMFVLMIQLKSDCDSDLFVFPLHLLFLHWNFFHLFTYFQHVVSGQPAISKIYLLVLDFFVLFFIIFLFFFLVNFFSILLPSFLLAFKHLHASKKRKKRRKKERKKSSMLQRSISFLF